MTILLAIIIYLVDPLQQYRQATFYKPYFSNQRYMNPGMVKTDMYDTLLLGTSHIENFIPKNVNQILGVDLLKVPMNGGTIYEISQVMNTAIKSGKVKSIIYFIDYFSFSGDSSGVRYKELPSYLYDYNYLNDYKYILNIDILIKEILVKIIGSNVFGINKNRLNKENPYSWIGRAKFGKEYVLSETTIGKTIGFDHEKFSLENFQKNFDANVTPLLSNKKVTFHLVFPPYSIVKWNNIKNEQWLDRALAFKKYVHEQTQFLDNVFVHDFHFEKEMIFNFNEYCDATHFSLNIQKQIMQSIKMNEHVKNTFNYEHEIKKISNYIGEFNENYE
jgi:hypothetical protein